MTEYEYEYYSVWKNHPNTNTNIIRFENINQIWIRIFWYSNIIWIIFEYRIIRSPLDSTLSPYPGESTQAGNARRALSMWSFKLVSINFCRECTFSNFHLSSSHSASAKLVPFPLINGQIDGCLIWRLIGRRMASCGPNIWANIPSKYSPLFSFLQLSKHLERLKRWPDISFPKYTPPTAIPIHQS